MIGIQILFLFKMNIGIQLVVSTLEKLWLELTPIETLTWLWPLFTPVTSATAKKDWWLFQLFSKIEKNHFTWTTHSFIYMFVKSFRRTIKKTNMNGFRVRWTAGRSSLDQWGGLSGKEPRAQLGSNTFNRCRLSISSVSWSGVTSSIQWPPLKVASNHLSLSLLVWILTNTRGLFGCQELV